MECYSCGIKKYKFFICLLNFFVLGVFIKYLEKFGGFDVILKF